jgi:putative oxidoreductase
MTTTADVSAYEAPTQRKLHFGNLLFGQGVVDRMAAAGAWPLSALLLLLRLWIAEPFLRAGLARLNSWDFQPDAFRDFHPVPGLAPEIAAPVTVAAELILPVLLVLGLFARPAALGLAIMAATILFVVGSTPEGQAANIANAAEQLPWIVVGLLLFVTGPGFFSHDQVIADHSVNPKDDIGVGSLAGGFVAMLVCQALLLYWLFARIVEGAALKLFPQGPQIF